MAQRAYRTLLAQRRDQAIVPMGRSGAGKTTSCQLALEHLVGMAGSVDGRVSGMGWVSGKSWGSGRLLSNQQHEGRLGLELLHGERR